MGNSKMKVSFKRRSQQFYLNIYSILKYFSNLKTALILLILLSDSSVNAQKEPVDQGMADNMRKISELYGIATQIMNLGGNILNNAGGGGGNGGGGGGGSGGISSLKRSSANYGDGGNGIFGEVVRPQIKGFEASSYDGIPRGSSGNFGGLFSEYGGGQLGEGSRSQPRSILDTLMGSFLGSSIGSSGASSPNFFSPSFEETSKYGNTKKSQGSNIEAIVNALSRSGAKRAESESDVSGPTSFLNQFFGGKR